MESVIDVRREYIAAPSVLDRRGLPQAEMDLIQLLQQRELVIPGQLCKWSLHNCLIWPGTGEGSCP